MISITPPYVTNNPKLNLNNPLTKELVVCWVPLRSGYVDLISGNRADINTAASFPQLITDQIGPTIFAQSSTDRIDGGLIDKLNSDTKIYSAFTYSRLIFSSPSEAVMFAQRDINGNKRFSFGVSDLNDLILKIGTSTFTIATGLDIDDDFQRSVSFSLDGTNARFFIDGIPLGNQDISTATPDPGNIQFSIGNEWQSYPTSNTSTTLPNWRVGPIYAWNKSLSDLEQLSISNDPWQLFEKPNRLFVIVPRNSGHLVSQNSSMAGSGTKVGIGSGNLQSQSSTTSGTGFKTVTASASLQSQNSSTTGSGFKVAGGSGNLQSQNSSTLGFGFKAVKGLGVLQSQNSSSLGNGFKTSRGIGNLKSKSPNTFGSGFKSSVANGNLLSKPSKIVGDGNRVGIGNGILDSQDSSTLGFGFLVKPVDLAKNKQSFIYFKRQQSYVGE